MPGGGGGGERSGGGLGGCGGGVGGGGGGHTAMPTQMAHSAQRSSVRQWCSLQKGSQMSARCCCSAGLAPFDWQSGQPAHRVSK